MTEPETNDDEVRRAELNARIVALGGRLHDHELTSADHLGTRSGALIGFAGVVLTVTVAVSRDAFDRGVDLGEVGDPAFAVLYLLAVMCLLIAAAQGVRAAIPRGRPRVNPGVFDTYRAEQPSVSDADGHFGRKQQQVVERLAQSNADRARSLLWGFGWLAAGVCLVAGQAFIIGVDRITEVL